MLYLHPARLTLLQGNLSLILNEHSLKTFIMNMMLGIRLMLMRLQVIDFSNLKITLEVHIMAETGISWSTRIGER